MIARCWNGYGQVDGYCDVPHTVRLIRFGDTYYARDESPSLAPGDPVPFVQTHCFVPREGLRKEPRR